ncbi:MAG TPA: 50S ribosomal protein L24 [Candidatus Colwellbacteria bacterium]|nr:50S ribosomal protein L24 [Candidatus Colwellbacteria bacterium]HQA95811.1 50S ribosomal protein L24 [Candidatus Colwellbacteria bacterium]
MNIKKNDNVYILKGKDAGKSGKVLKVDSKLERIVVSGINQYKKAVKPKKEGEKGQFVTISRPIDISNAMLVCPKCGKKSRVGYRIEKDKKIRYCKKCKATI